MSNKMTLYLVKKLVDYLIWLIAENIIVKAVVCTRFNRDSHRSHPRHDFIRSDIPPVQFFENKWK